MRATSSIRLSEGGLRAAACLILFLLPVAAARANWTASGRFMYVDRDEDQTGFTGIEPQRPVRFADVQIIDSAGTKLLAKGATDANGNYSIPVVDSKKRTVYARIVSQSLNTPNLFVDVQDGSGHWYAVATSSVANHNSNTNTDFGTRVAAKGAGGEVFNIFDQTVYGADYIAFLRGSRPPQADDLTVLWASNRGVMDSNYQSVGRNLSLRDTAGYDDTVILHEMGHYFVFEYSASDNPGGAHTFSDCDRDIRLAWEEGFATYWGNSVLRYFSFPHCNIYTRTDGGSGPGHLVRYANLENDPQYPCEGDQSELDVFTMLWDINDSASTTDTTPGVDDSQDQLSEPDSQNWEVMRDYMPAAANKSMEDFWDGWFKAPISNDHRPEMLNISRFVGIDFSEDASEVNNSAATSAPITVGTSTPATFFYDSNGDGAGEADTDYFFFSASGGQAYRAETTNLLNDGNTFLEILDTDGTTVLASNDDRVSGDHSSLINWTAPRSDTFYLRVTHTAGLGIYGSYSLLLSLQQ